MFHNIYKSIYNLLVSEEIKKQQRNIPKKDLDKIEQIIQQLKGNPRPFKSKKLKGEYQDYRIRYRNWRILYTIDDKNKQIIVYGILDRKEAYR